MAILNNSNAISTAGGYDINNSLRFRSNGYLSRAYSSSGTIDTWSFWIKRGKLGSAQTIFGTSNGVNQSFGIEFTASDTIQVYDYLNAFRVQLYTTQVFRDPSAWYHIVLAIDTTQATAANRVKFYVNGIQVTAFSTATYPTINQSLNIGGVLNLGIGITGNIGGQLYDGYMTEWNFIDGQALTPSSFGETDAVTGSWVAKKYTGTYGTNGFYLKFSDIATTSGSNAGLGKDFSGNTNYWTTNNISVTAGTTYDAMIDSPTLTSATVANYATWLALRPTFSQGNYQNGNLEWYQTSAGSGSYVCSSIGVFSGKWYAEFSFSGSVNSTSSFVGFGTMFNIYALVGYRADGKTEGGATFGASFTTGDILGVAYDQSTNTATFYKNNTSQGTQSFTIDQTLGGAFVASTIGNGSTIIANFGQRPFTYTPPTGFVRLNTYNLPDSTIKKGNTVMDATLYTGNGSTQTVTNAAGFKPDWVWLKERSSTSSNNVYDSIRGTTKYLLTNAIDAEGTDATSLTAFNSNGFSLGGAGFTNENAQTYVGWQWQAGQGSTTTGTGTGGITSVTQSVNTTAGFSIVTFTGSATAGTITHGLGVAPKMVIVKARSVGTSGWAVWHSAFVTAGGTDYLILNNSGAKNQYGSVDLWNNTAPTSSVISLGTQGTTNAASTTFVAYCWAEIAGFSKFGSYTGNGSTDGPFIFCNFRPKFVMIKRTVNAGGSWAIYDTARNTYNVANLSLYPNLSSADDTYDVLDFTSNGFKIRTSSLGVNQSGDTFIVAAFAESPFKNSNAR